MSAYASFLTRGDSLTKTAIGMAKPSFYKVDGSGRDSYIANNNGGLYAPYSPSYVPDVGTFS